MDFDNLFNPNKYPLFVPEKLEPDDNGPCICLSGQSYINCCKSKICASRSQKSHAMINDGLDELYFIKESKLPSRKLVSKVILKKKLGYCMAADIFHDCSCMNGSSEADIRFSHTLSRGYVLKNLCNSNSEMVTYINDHPMIYDAEINVEDRFKQIPIEDASKTTSFCKKHDDYLFEDIEKPDKRAFSGSYIQSLEYALKAVTFDLFDNLKDIYYLASLAEHNVNVVFDNENESRLLSDYRLKLNRFYIMKNLSNRLISDIKRYKDTGTISNLETIIVYLKKCSRVEYSLADVFEYGYCLNVVNAPNPFVVLSYYPDINNGNIYIVECVRKLKQKQNDRTLREFTNYILTNAVNIYFNSDMINNFSNSDLKKLFIVHRNGFGSLSSEQSIFSLRLISKLYNTI